MTVTIMEGSVSEHRVDLDDEALTRVAQELGTTTTSETVNAALREIAQRHRRREAWQGLAEMAQAGDFDVLLNKKNYRR